MHNKITISRNINIINTLQSNHTLKEGVVENSKEEAEEEVLVEEEVKLHAITVENQVTMSYIS